MATPRSLLDRTQRRHTENVEVKRSRHCAGGPGLCVAGRPSAVHPLRVRAASVRRSAARVCAHSVGAIGFGSERRSGLARADVRSARGAARDVDRAAAAPADRFPRFRRCEPARLPVGDRHQLCATLVPGANRHRQSRCRGIHRRDRRRAAVEHPGREQPEMVAAARDRRQRQREGCAERLRGPCT